MFTLVTILITAVYAGVSMATYTETPSYMIMNSIVEGLCEWETGSSGGGAYTLVESVYKLVIPAALSLALCYAILELMNSVTRVGVENVTASVIIVPFIRFAACWLLMKYGLKITGLIMSSSNYLVDQIQANMQSGSGNITGETPMETASLMSRFVFEVLPSMLAMIGQVIAGIMLAFQIVSIRIEFLLRASLLPLAIANVAQGGANSAGARYIKKLIGNMFMMMGIVVTVELTFLMLSSANISLDVFPGENAELVNRFIGAIFSGLVGPFAAVGCVGAFKAAINDAFG